MSSAIASMKLEINITLPDGTVFTQAVVMPDPTDVVVVSPSTVDLKSSKMLPRGVLFCKRSNTFKARIFYAGKSHWLGDFKTVDEASEAYKRERLLHPRVNHWKRKRGEAAAVLKRQKTA